MIGIPLGLLTANATEWVMHKYVLHGLGRKKSSFWSFHWHDHHRNSRKNGNYDAQYETHPFKNTPQGKEALALAAGAIPALAVMPFAPFLGGTLLYAGFNYYRVHKKSHLDPEWARQNLPWHYDHHMGPNQHANWCVTKPWFDHIMGTRQPYVGTEREERDIKRAAEKKKNKAARAPTPARATRRAAKTQAAG